MSKNNTDIQKIYVAQVCIVPLVCLQTPPSYYITTPSHAPFSYWLFLTFVEGLSMCSYSQEHIKVIFKNSQNCRFVQRMAKNIYTF